VIEQDLQLIFKLQDACEDYGLKLTIARSADEATLYLRGIGVYGDRETYPVPGLILLDTESRNAVDLRVLEWVRESPRFRKVPVALLAHEPPHKARVSCAIDPDSFVIDRTSLWELPSVAWQVFFSGNPQLARTNLARAEA
jgi:hypothetical protein